MLGLNLSLEEFRVDTNFGPAGSNTVLQYTTAVRSYHGNSRPANANRHLTAVNLAHSKNHATNTSHWEGGQVGVVRTGDAKNTIARKWTQDPDLKCIKLLLEEFFQAADMAINRMVGLQRRSSYLLEYLCQFWAYRSMHCRGERHDGTQHLRSACARGRRHIHLHRPHLAISGGAAVVIRYNACRKSANLHMPPRLQVIGPTVPGPRPATHQRPRPWAGWSPRSHR